jgi:hypothetical protein
MQPDVRTCIQRSNIDHEHFRPVKFLLLMTARSTFNQFASSRRRSSRSRARNMSSRCSKASNSCWICSAQPSPAEIEDFSPALIRAPSVTRRSYHNEELLQLQNESGTFNRTSNDDFAECDASSSAARGTPRQAQATVHDGALNRVAQAERMGNGSTNHQAENSSQSTIRALNNARAGLSSWWRRFCLSNLSFSVFVIQETSVFDITD